MEWDEAKIIVKILKLYTSSLFARRSPYLILDMIPNACYFSNIELSMVWNRPLVDSTIHRVKFHQDFFLNELYNLFPVLRDHYVLLELKTLNSLFNSVLKESCNLMMAECNGVLYIDQTVIGYFITEDQFTGYVNIFETYLETSTEEGVVIRETALNPTKRSGTESITLLTDNPASLQSCYRISAIYSDGITGISYTEYAKKLKVDFAYSYNYWNNNGIYRACVKFVVPNKLEVISVMPRLLYLPIDQ